MSDNKQIEKKEIEQPEPRELSLEEMDSVSGGALNAYSKATEENLK
jgi:hypothetical protein